jgi:hypothetical protein
MSATTEIGTAAGKVWQFLDKNGPSNITKIGTETGVAKNELQRAIGWLCKEGKLSIEIKGKVETISLK